MRALCDFPAANLVNGTLPATSPSGGSAPSLITTAELQPGGSTVAFGDLNGDGARRRRRGGQLQRRRSRLARLHRVLASGPAGPVLLGVYQMGDAVGDARNGTTKVSYEPGGTIRIHSLTPAASTWAAARPAARW